MKPVLYVDIDGVLLANEHNLTQGATEFIKYVADNFEVYWLTAHCRDGNADWAVEYVNRTSKEDLTPWLSKFKPTSWGMFKTDAIDMAKDFIWFDDDVFEEEYEILKDAKKLDCLHEVDLQSSPLQMKQELNALQSLYQI